MHIACFERTMSDDGALLNLLARWLPVRDRHKVLVENPAGCMPAGLTPTAATICA
jgi:hypothetical protein